MRPSFSLLIFKDTISSSLSFITAVTPQQTGLVQDLVGCRLWGRTESDTTEMTQQQHGGFCHSEVFKILIVKSVTIFHYGFYFSHLAKENLSPHPRTIKILFYVLTYYSIEHSMKLKQVKVILGFIVKQMKQNCLETQQSITCIQYTLKVSLDVSQRKKGKLSLWNSPGQNTGVDSLSILQGFFPTQGQNPGLLHCRQILYQLNHKQSPLHFTSKVSLDVSQGKKMKAHKVPENPVWME